MSWKPEIDLFLVPFLALNLALVGFAASLARVFIRVRSITKEAVPPKQLKGFPFVLPDEPKVDHAAAKTTLVWTGLANFILAIAFRFLVAA